MFDLAIAYTWIYDTEFTELIEEMFHHAGLKTFLVTRHNVDEITARVKSKELKFKVYLDRASDEDEAFEELAQLLSSSDCKIINEYSKVESAVDKSVIHPKLIENGLRLPYTKIIPPFDVVSNLDLSEKELIKLGNPFVVKPAYYSGGSEGVYKNAVSLDDIQKARMEYGDDNYLLQEKIIPKKIHNHRAWFRVLWAFGKVIIMLWDDELLLYSDFETSKLDRELTKHIEQVMGRIHSISQLDYFSSEFALTEENKMYLIDYVNDQCDFRLKSNHPDGVPDEIVKKFIWEMMEFVKGT